MREIDGLTYAHIPMNATRPCALCGHRGCRCEAKATEPRRSIRRRPGVTLCGFCWEDGDAETIRRAVMEA